MSSLIRTVPALALALALAPGHALATEGDRLAEGSPVCDRAPERPLRVVRSRNLSYFGGRPHALTPTGVSITVRPQAGMTEADVHRAAVCGSDGALPSPVLVRGAEIEVRRSGAVYQLRITSRDRSAALEIQRRTDALIAAAERGEHAYL